MIQPDELLSSAPIPNSSAVTKNENKLPNIQTIRARKSRNSTLEEKRTLTDDKRSINTINRLPNIQMIGAQKAGSTAVYTWLHANNICGPTIGANESSYRIKESHFFDKKLYFFDGKHSNVTFYANLYRNCTNYDYTMDATPSAFKHPNRVNKTYVA